MGKLAAGIGGGGHAAKPTAAVDGDAHVRRLDPSQHARQPRAECVDIELGTWHTHPETRTDDMHVRAAWRSGRRVRRRRRGGVSWQRWRAWRRRVLAHRIERRRAGRDGWWWREGCGEGWRWRRGADADTSTRGNRHAAAATAAAAAARCSKGLANGDDGAWREGRGRRGGGRGHRAISPQSTVQWRWLARCGLHAKESE